jgi:hypothetical protein
MPALHRGWTALIFAWLFAVGAGLVGFAHYKSRPGEQAAAPAQWPEQSVVALDGTRPTLLLLAHPRCPCTRASIAELSRLAARLEGKVAVRVLFLKPEGVGEGWERSDLWTRASGIAGAQLLTDRDGREARRFGTVTSGQALLYAADGALLFSGGLTLSRGHEGESPGVMRITELVERGQTQLASAPVFGCDLRDRPNREAP